MQATIETDMNSVERVLEYTQLPPEAPAILPDSRPPPAWPTQGAITAERLVVRYRPDLDPVLKVCIAHRQVPCIASFVPQDKCTLWIDVAPPY